MEKVSTAKSSVRIRWSQQAESFSAVPGDSMRYVLLLNGVVSGHYATNRGDQARDAVREGGFGPEWLVDELSAASPESSPGAAGPIALVLVL